MRAALTEALGEPGGGEPAGQPEEASIRAREAAMPPGSEVAVTGTRLTHYQPAAAMAGVQRAAAASTTKGSFAKAV